MAKKKNIGYYTSLWEEMITNDDDKIKHWKNIDKAVQLDYELPAKMKNQKWMRNIVSSIPLTVIVTGKKVLTTIEPSFFIQPLNDEPETIKRANALEQNLAWQFQQMDKRGKNSFILELVESALRYDSIAAFTVPIKWQMEGNTSAQYKAALNQDGFMTLIENPKNIHSRFSPLGLESVLSAKVMRAKDAAIFFGSKAKKLQQAIEGSPTEQYVSVFDYWSYDERIVRISKPTTDDVLASPTAGGWIIEQGEMELPFLPWTIVEGGTALATEEDHKVRPILGPLVHTEQWELMCLLQSMAFSEVTAYRAAPRGIITSPSGETVRVDYGDINQNIILKPGEKYEKLDPPSIDDNLLLVHDRLEGTFNQLTGLKALTELDSPSGTAFATVNAQIKQATTALDPPKRLAERALSTIGENILRWTAHTGDDLVGYGFQDASMGKELVQKKEHIDPQDIYVNVSLSHHIPTDELQQINAATMLMRDLGISFVDAAKKLDISNPEEMLARANQERLNQAAIERRIREMDAESDLKIQAKQMQLQMGAQQAQRQQQMEIIQNAQGGMNEESMSQSRTAGASDLAPSKTGGERKTIPSRATGGAGNNPALGGESPNIVNPSGLTKEGSTGVDRGGGGI